MYDYLSRKHLPSVWHHASWISISKKYYFNIPSTGVVLPIFQNFIVCIYSNKSHIHPLFENSFIKVVHAKIQLKYS